MSLEKLGQIGRVERNIRCPLVKATMLVDGLDPLSDGSSPGLVLPRVLILNLKHERLSYDKLRSVAEDESALAA